MKKREKKNRKKIIYALPAAAVWALLLVGGILARYIQTGSHTVQQVQAEAFYFTAELLGDDTMTGTDSYAFPTAQGADNTWELYGGNACTIPIEVRNYSDEKRITAETISYSASVVVPTNAALNLTDEKATTLQKKITLNMGTNNGTLVQEDGDDPKQMSDIIKLTIPAYDDTSFAYPDGTTVTVKIISSSPYKKEIDLNFKLLQAKTGLSYQIKDAAKSQYAELILMSDTDEIQPSISWPTTDLSIDRTNPLTYKNSFDQQPITTTGEISTMKLSQSLSAGESASIYFFKADRDKNYSTDGIRTVTPDTSETDGTSYTITIPE